MLETRLHIIRHAPVRQADGRIYGATDKSADTSNTAAFTSLARRLPAHAVAVVTHLMRTQQTMAAIRAAGLDLPEPLVEARLGEQDFGGWVGLTHDEVRRRYGNAYDRFWVAPASEKPPDGESFLELAKRVHECLNELSDRFAGHDIVCVAHGGSVRAALALALGVEPAIALRFSVGTLSTTLLDRLHPEPGFAGGWRIRGTNIPP